MTIKSLNIIFSQNNKLSIMSKENNSNVHPIFDGLFAGLKKPFNSLTEEDKEDLNSKDKEDESMAAIARKSHLNNRLSGHYDFLQLTPDNINTYELGFMAGVMYATGEMDKLREKQNTPTLAVYEATGIADKEHEGLIN